MSKGYAGVAIYQPKFVGNLGAVLRSVHCLGGEFVSLIGARYPGRQPADTTDAAAHVPIWQYGDMGAFLDAMPDRATVVSVEVDGDIELRRFEHPASAIYLIGGEDRTLPRISGPRVRIESLHCLNLAMATTIVLYDRLGKRQRSKRVLEALQQKEAAL